MGLELPKAVMIYLMVPIDVTAALLFLWMGLALTKEFGFGSRRELLLFTHRIALVCCAVAFVYHAFDIWTDPARHGLTFSNFALHTALIFVIAVSSIRIKLSEKLIYRGTNGGGFSGPIHHRSGPIVSAAQARGTFPSS